MFFLAKERSKISLKGNDLSRNSKLKQKSRIYSVFKYQNFNILAEGQMRNLKSALSKEDKVQVKNGTGSESIRSLRNNNSDTMWSVGMALEEQDHGSVFPPSLLADLQSQIQRMQARHISIDETSISILIQKYTNSLEKSESDIESIQLFQKMLSLVSKTISPDCESSIKGIQSAVRAKARKMKNKNRGAMEFDEITTKLFKKSERAQKVVKDKKRQILEANLSPEITKKQNRKSRRKHDSNGTKNSGSGSQDSGDVKLGKLLSSDKFENKGNLQKSEGQTEQSYNFSAVMSATMSIKQRQSRNGKQDKEKVNYTNGRKTHEEDFLDKDKDDDAFMFFRPKRGRK